MAYDIRLKNSSDFDTSNNNITSCLASFFIVAVLKWWQIYPYLISNTLHTYHKQMTISHFCFNEKQVHDLNCRILNVWPFESFQHQR